MGQHQDPEKLLSVWKEAWSNAGFQPIVLSLQDAKRHPRYKYILPMLDGIQFKDGKDKFNFVCFLRWVAMSNSGGGWMADYDTFPLNIKPSFTLPNEGKFTVHAGHLPTLLSGTASEWNRMAKLIFSDYRDRVTEKKSTFFGKKTTVSSWSDYLSLKRIHSIDNSTFIVKYETRDLYDFYEMDLQALEYQKRIKNTLVIPDLFDLKNKCNLSNDGNYLAIHFLHFKYESFYKRETNLDRNEFIRKWIQSWVE